MKFSYLGRATLTAGLLASMGQQTALAYSPLESAIKDIRPAQTANNNESTENLFQRVSYDLRTLEKERKSSFKNSRELYQSLGLLVYNDLSMLAAKFGIKLETDGLMAFSMGENTQTDQIVVKYYSKDNAGEPETAKISFYQDNVAVVGTSTLVDYFRFRTIRRRLKVNSRNGLEFIQEENPTLYSENFAYITDMQKFDFQKVSRNLAQLLLEKKNLGNFNPDSDKHGEVRSRINLIAKGLFERYGGVPGVLIQRDEIFAKNGVITLCADYTAYYGGILWLKIQDEESAELALQRDTGTIDFEFRWRIKNFKIKPGDSIEKIVNEIE